MVEINFQGPPLDEAKVALFEDELGARLPQLYRSFLLSYNGGQPVPDTIDIDGLPDGPTGVHDFFGIDQDADGNELRENLEDLAEDIDDPNLLPIANDAFGDTFCIAISGPNYGTIYFVTYQDEGSKKYFVANSFDAFLSKLRVFEEGE